MTINRAYALGLLIAAFLLRCAAWVLDPAGRRFQPKKRLTHATSLPRPTHFHAQRECSYCGAAAGAQSRCDGCGAPPLLMDATLNIWSGSAAHK